MKEKEYYNEISNIIETIEVNTRVRQLQDNSEKLQAYWNIGRLIVEAQGGANYASYGDNLMKKWANTLMLQFGKRYNYRELYKIRAFYNIFKKFPTLSGTLSWSHIVEILPIKNANTINYYLNQVILNNISVRELREEIKSKAFERLSYADKNNIKLIENENYTLSLEDMIKDPILIKTNKNISKINEKALHIMIIEMLEKKFLELGTGFTLAGHEYKINVEGHCFKIDLLFFNVKLNAYVVVELKTKAMEYQDCEQLIFYTKLVDKYVKEKNNNRTLGILIVREYDSFMIKYATSRDVLTATYKLVES